MKKYFVWSRYVERSIYKTLSDKGKRLASNSDAVIKLFGRAIETSEHYYAFAGTMHELSRHWKDINKSPIHRMLERNERLWAGVGLIFSALELQKVLNAPDRSIIIPTFDVLGGYGFEVIKPNDTNYKEAASLLPGVT